MATVIFKNGANSDYANPANWVGGAAPAAGDTAVIDSTGDPLAMIDPNNTDIFGFATGDTSASLTGTDIALPSSILVQDPGTSNPVVYFQYYPDVPAGSQSTPGESIGNQTIDLIGGGSVAALYNQNSTLEPSSTVNVSGTSLWQSEFTNQLNGTISIGAPLSVNGSPVAPPAPNASNHVNELDIDVLPNGSWTYNNGAYALSGYVPSVTNNGTINVAASSALNIQLTAVDESLFQNVQTPTETVVDDFPPERTAFNNNGTINIQAGGTANIFGAPAILQVPTAENGNYVPAPFNNNGTINVDGAAGATTSFMSDEPIVGGTLNVNGGNATDPGATTATIADGQAGTNIVLTNATLDLVEHNHDVNTPQFANQFSGGSITFADSHGVIAFPTSSLTNPEIDTTVGDIATPINGLRAGDAIDVTLVPGVLSAINTRGVFSFAANWVQATGDLQIIETVAISSFYGGGTTSQTVADFKLGGTYAPSSFHVAWSPDPFSGNNGFGGNPVTLTITTTDASGGAPCFVGGTLIATPDGEIPVEDIRPGDLVLTADGTTPRVRWVGHRRADCRANPDHAPVRVRAGALGAGTPRRDLAVSPDHALFIDGVLIPAERLVNGGTIVRAAATCVIYHHVELDHHAILLAEGAPAESYLDTGNRSRFGNCPLGYDPVVAAANDPCADMLFAGPRLEAIRARLSERQPACP